MSNYLAHKRAKTFFQQPEIITNNPERGYNYHHVNSYKKQIQRKQESKQKIQKQIKGLRPSPYSKLSGSQVGGTKYKCFPRELDLYLKPRKDQQFLFFPEFKPSEKFHQNKRALGLKKKGRKVDSRQMFLSGQLGDHKPISGTSSSQVRIPSFLLSRKVKKNGQPFCLAANRSYQHDQEGFAIGCMKLKETSSTINLNNTLLSEVSKKVQDQVDCLDLSFEMGELLNRSINEKMANDKDAAQGAVRELQLLLDF